MQAALIWLWLVQVGNLEPESHEIQNKQISSSVDSHSVLLQFFSCPPKGKCLIRLELFCCLNTLWLALLAAVCLALLGSVWVVNWIYIKWSVRYKWWEYQDMLQLWVLLGWRRKYRGNIAGQPLLDKPSFWFLCAGQYWWGSSFAGKRIKPQVSKSN